MFSLAIVKTTKSHQLLFICLSPLFGGLFRGIYGQPDFRKSVTVTALASIRFWHLYGSISWARKRCWSGDWMCGGCILNKLYKVQLEDRNLWMYTLIWLRQSALEVSGSFSQQLCFLVFIHGYNTPCMVALKHRCLLEAVASQSERWMNEWTSIDCKTQEWICGGSHNATLMTTDIPLFKWTFTARISQSFTSSGLGSYGYIETIKETPDAAPETPWLTLLVDYFHLKCYICLQTSWKTHCSREDTKECLQPNKRLCPRLQNPKKRERKRQWKGDWRS